VVWLDAVDEEVNSKLSLMIAPFFSSDFIVMII